MPPCLVFQWRGWRDCGCSFGKMWWRSVTDEECSSYSNMDPSLLWRSHTHTHTHSSASRLWLNLRICLVENTSEVSLKSRKTDSGLIHGRGVPANTHKHTRCHSGEAASTQQNRSARWQQLSHGHLPTRALRFQREVQHTWTQWLWRAPTHWRVPPAWGCSDWLTLCRLSDSGCSDFTQEPTEENSRLSVCLHAQHLQRKNYSYKWTANIQFLNTPSEENPAFDLVNVSMWWRIMTAISFCFQCQCQSLKNTAWSRGPSLSQFPLH